MTLDLKIPREKRYDPNDSTLTFAAGEDELGWFASPRALMSCGHVATPTLLTRWCRRLLDQGESRFVCGQTGCNVEWSYEEVCKMALLTPEEKKHFEKAMKSNAATCFPTKPCPKCTCPVVRRRRSSLRVRCTMCPGNLGDTFRFCWQCLRRWRGPAPRSDRCASYGCTNELVKLLQSCPEAAFKRVSGAAGCPSMRACPACGILLQHDSRRCKNVRCLRCRVQFCFVCLKRTTVCCTTSDMFAACSSGVAPRQTSIPEWWRKRRQEHRANVIQASVCL